MIRNIKRRYFEIWGDEQAQNAFLKGTLCVTGVLFILQSIALTIVCLKAPVLVAVGQEESKALTLQPPAPALLKSELDRTVRNYLTAHYTWDQTTVEKAHADAARYVGKKYISAFNQANAEQVRLAKEKQVKERAYIASLSIDEKALVARASIDRIIIVSGLIAATPINLEITFEYGDRTSTNPEGIYITGEKVVDTARQ